MQNPKRRHHYIPVFYLNGFVNDKGYIWVYDKDDCKIFDSKPEGIAFENHYFSFMTLNGEKDSETIENLIMYLEGESSKVVKKILSCESLNEDEKVSFAYFIALMMVRVPNFRKNIELGVSKTMEKVNTFIASDKARFEHMIKKYEQDTGNKIGESTEDLRQFILSPEKYELKTNPQFSLDLSLEMLQDFSKVFFNMKWAFLKATDDYKFICGDNPFYYMDPTYKTPSYYGVGLLHDNIEVTLPLSRDMCAFGSWKHRERYLQAKNQMVKLINQRTVVASLRFVFASENSETLKRFVMKYKDSSPKIQVG